MTMLRRAGLLAPMVLTIGVLLIVPLAIMAYVSTLARGPSGGVIWTQHTADAYAQFLFERDLADRLVVNTDYLHIFARSLGLAAITTVVTFLVAFPMALWMAFQPPRRRMLLVFIVTVPFWTNILVRNYAWILLLRNDGVIDWGLRKLGVTAASIDVLYTPDRKSVV